MWRKGLTGVGTGEAVGGLLIRTLGGISRPDAHHSGGNRYLDHPCVPQILMQTKYLPLLGSRLGVRPTGLPLPAPAQRPPADEHHHDQHEHD